MAFSTPASAQRSSTWSISGLPATRMSGFGIVLEMGRMRVPRPAANTIALWICNPAIVGPTSRRLHQRSRQMVLVPGLELGQNRMAETLDEIALDARQVRQILRLAVPPVEAGKETQELGGALRPRDRIGAREGRRIEIGIDAPPRLGILAYQPQFQLVRHGHAGILQQGRDVVGRRPEHAILEIDQ